MRSCLMWWRGIAAKPDTSVNALFNAELRYLVETFEAAETGGNQFSIRTNSAAEATLR